MHTLSLSPGSWTILALAGFSSIALLFYKDPPAEGLEFWLFSKHHESMYRQTIVGEADPVVSPVVISFQALERRLLSGFLSDTPVPDVVEVEIAMAARFFSGPLEAIGFLDLRERIEAEGLDRRINPPAFSPWSREGRIFGLPHDMHPVLLGYRADIVEAAGIDVTEIETWDDFVRLFSPLMRDFTGDGVMDRYLLDVWETDAFAVEILLLQAGGGFFDTAGRPVLQSEINARVLATLVTWTTGDTRIGANVPRFDAGGNRQRLEGFVICHLLPDWYAGGLQREVPGLAGKLKLMPLPAWERGGNRTSAIGGTMISIPARASDPDAAWEFAKKLYLDKDIAREMYQESLIVSPVMDHWEDAVYDEPVPFYSGQPVGRLYLEVAPAIPPRAPSPFLTIARESVIDALIRTRREAMNRSLVTVEAILPVARRELGVAQRHIEGKMSRNRFLQPPGETP
ncbi:MAG: extracellular solute-binding protein [Verrucomicrobia bacterium]|nr:extracellular solute-binding protein [Verrucomicrobiota bacterium]